MSSWQKLLTLSYKELWILGQAWALIPIAALTLRLVRLEPLLATLKRHCPTPHSAVDPDTVQSIARMMKVAARYSLRHATCLERSLVLWWLLRRRGIGANIQIGVRKDSDQIEAHAWVELDGVVINDYPDIGATFAPLPTTDREHFS